MRGFKMKAFLVKKFVKQRAKRIKKQFGVIELWQAISICLNTNVFLYLRKQNEYWVLIN